MVDYSNLLKTANPMQIAMQGYAQGSQVANAMQERRDNLAMTQELAQLAQNKSATPEDYFQMIAKYPKLEGAISSIQKGRSEEQNKIQQRQALNLFTLVKTGQIDAAKETIQNLKTAAENSNRPSDVAVFDSMLKMADMPGGIDSLTTTAGLKLAHELGPEKFADAYQKIEQIKRDNELQDSILEQKAADLDLTKANINEVKARTKNLSIEGKKAVLELEALKDPDGTITDPTIRFEKERDLRKEYQTRIDDFNKSKINLDKLRDSAQANTGAGDVALIFSFMKMLDPASVVRESEFAVASDTAGLYQTLKNLAEKAQSGQRLSKSQKDNFVKLAEKYMKSTEKLENGVKKDLRNVVKTYGLNEVNVFGEEKKEEKQQYTDKTNATTEINQSTLPSGWSVTVR